MTRMTSPVLFWNDQIGRTLDEATLDFYDSGTFNRKDTFTDAALSAANPNPVVADGAGRFPDIFLGSGAYRAVLTDKNGVEIWTKDNVVNYLSADEAAGQTEIDVSGGSNIDLTSGQTAVDTLVFTGTSIAPITVRMANDLARQYTVINSDDGGFAITLATATGTGVEFSQEGEQRTVRSDGTNMVNDYSSHYETNGTADIDVSGSTNVNATEEDISGNVITFSGTSTGDHDVTWPNDVPGMWVIENNDAGGFTMTVVTATGTGVDLLGGGRKYLIRSDGTDMVLVATLEPQFGVDQSWQSFTVGVDRSAGVEYTAPDNETIVLYFRIAASLNFNVTIDGVEFTGPTTASGTSAAATYVVGPGQSYEVSTGTVTQWVEFRL